MTVLNVEEVSFHRFFLAASLSSDNSQHLRHLTEIPTTTLLSSVEAVINGYAVFCGTPTDLEIRVLEDLPTRAFLEDSHHEFLVSLKISSNKILSSIKKISI